LARSLADAASRGDVDAGAQLDDGSLRLGNTLDGV